MTFKVGDRVIVMKQGPYYGDYGLVLYQDPDFNSTTVFLEIDKIKITINSNFLVKSEIPSCPGVPEMKTENKQSSNDWSFNSLHVADIDWTELTQSVSRKNPVALISIGEDQFCAVIHRNLVRKEEECFESSYFRENYEVVDDSTSKNLLVFLDGVEDFKDIVKECKRIKETPWPHSNHKKRRVTVTYPAI